MSDVDSQVITGTKISELCSLEAFAENDNEHIFLVLEPTDSTCSEYKNRYVSYIDLKIALYAELEKILGLQSMSKENTIDYALREHVHTEANAISVQVETAFDKNNVIAAVQVDNKCHEIHSPYATLVQSDDTEVGQLKFVGCEKLAPLQIGIYDDNFDGWVYADGKTYQTLAKSDFKSAKENFKTSTDKMSFTVPCLSDFIRPDVSNEDHTGTIPDWHIQTNSLSAVVPHVHRVEFHATSTVSVEISGNATFGGETHDAQYIIRGTSPSYQKQFDATATVDKLTLRSFEATAEGTTGIEQTHPSYNLIPVMVYIGKYST